MIAAYAIGAMQHPYMKKKLEWRRAITFTDPRFDFPCLFLEFVAPVGPTYQKNETTQYIYIYICIYIRKYVYAYRESQTP